LATKIPYGNCMPFNPNCIIDFLKPKSIKSC
jgi:hypothetical protein